MVPKPRSITETRLNLTSKSWLPVQRRRGGSVLWVCSPGTWLRRLQMPTFHRGLPAFIPWKTFCHVIITKYRKCILILPSFFPYDKLLPKLLWAEDKSELHEQEPFRHQRISEHSGKPRALEGQTVVKARVSSCCQTAVPLSSLGHLLICRRRISVTWLPLQQPCGCLHSPLRRCHL